MTNQKKLEFWLAQKVQEKNERAIRLAVRLINSLERVFPSFGEFTERFLATKSKNIEEMKRCKWGGLGATVDYDVTKGSQNQFSFSSIGGGGQGNNSGNSFEGAIIIFGKQYLNSGSSFKNAKNLKGEKMKF